MSNTYSPNSDSPRGPRSRRGSSKTDSRSLGAQDEPDPAHGMDYPRLSLVLEFASEGADAHVEHVGARVGGIPPDRMQQLFAADHAPSVADDTRSSSYSVRVRESRRPR